MSDLTDAQSATTTKIVGSNSSGVENNFAKVSTNQDVGTMDIINTSGVYGSLTVGTTAIEIKVGGSRLTARKLVTLDNISNVVFYWGYDSSITTSNYAGRIFKDQQVSWAVGDNISLYVIAGTAGNSARISEGS